MDDCVFCKIIKKEIPTILEAESTNVVAFKSIDPAASVHILVVPKKHIPSFLALEASDSQILIEMADLAKTLITKTGSEGAYKLIFNGGRNQVVPHVHWHLLGGDVKDYTKI